MRTKLLQPKNILLVEDNPADILLTKQALSYAEIAHNLHTVTNGLEALAFLENREEFENSPRPDLILLDLNLPIKDGRKVLEELKTHQSLRSIPVLILTTSEQEEDIRRAYHLNANSYIVKPIDFDQFCNIIKCIENYWFNIAELPTY